MFVQFLVHTADCAVSPQALHLLQSVKKLPEDAPHLFTHVSKLNSHQMHTLLRHCSMADNDQTVNTAFAEQLVRFAQIDEGLASEGVELEVDPNPDLPFLVPQRGYFTNSLRGVPPGLHEFLEPLVSSGEPAQIIMLHWNTSLRMQCTSVPYIEYNLFLA